MKTRLSLIIILAALASTAAPFMAQAAPSRPGIRVAAGLAPAVTPGQNHSFRLGAAAARRATTASSLYVGFPAVVCQAGSGAISIGPPNSTNATGRAYWKVQLWYLGASGWQLIVDSSTQGWYTIDVLWSPWFGSTITGSGYFQRYPSRGIWAITGTLYYNGAYAYANTIPHYDAAHGTYGTACQF